MQAAPGAGQAHHLRSRDVPPPKEVAMLRLPIPLSIIAAAVLAACTSDRATPAPVVVPSPPATTVVTPAPTAVVPGAVAVAPTAVVAAPALRPGNGRIESISAVPGQASAGASQPGAMRRVGV